jgi:hypothetical protein
MKKHIVYLTQLFEGEPAAATTGPGAGDGSTGAKGTDGSTTGDKGSDDGQHQKSEKKYTDDDLDKIIGKKFAEWKTKQDKAVDEAKRLATMTEQEKAEHERDQYKAQLDELLKKENRNEMGKVARKILSADGINLSDDLLGMIITDEADSTKSNVKQFSKMYKEAVAEGVKDALKGKTPGTGASGNVTKEQIMKIKDRVERQRMIAEHMDLFK